MADKNSEKGWICPKCGRTYAPWVSSCFYCGQHSITYTNPCPWYPTWYCNTISSDSITLNSNQVTGATTATTSNVKC